MKYELRNGVVDFTVPERGIELGRVSIALSGGTDSAAVLYMLCEEIVSKKLDVEIFPHTVVDIPGTNKYSQAIVEEYRKLFPDVIIHNTKVFTLPTDTLRNLTPEEKAGDELAHLVRKWKRANGLLCGISGVTQSPAELDRLDDRPTHGEHTDPYEEIMGSNGRVVSYFPLINVTKMFVTNLYHKHNLMSNIFPLTRSCVGESEETDNYSKPCKECWWCQEKYWAFGSYDHTED